MKSSQLISALVVAVILAIIGFFVSGIFDSDGQTVAIATFVGAFISPIICQFMSSGSNQGSAEIQTLYVGNLPYRANEAAVRALFSEFGVVHSVRLMKDKNTGKRRGFGFVEMNATDTKKAIDALNDTEFQQRTLKVREAKERPEKSDEQT